MAGHLLQITGSKLKGTIFVKPHIANPDRRSVIAMVGAAAGGLAGLPGASLAAPGSARTRAIASTGDRIPVIGMGSWITFNVGNNRTLRKARTEVLKTFFSHGGGLIDSSPMYGSSEDVIGDGLKRLGTPETLYSATKVWTSGRDAGIAQMDQSQAYWNGRAFDLMQIHNMLDWQTHYQTLTTWKAEGRIGALGITTSHGRRHADLERALTSKPFDTVQLTYNVLDREAEQRLLPLAGERGIGVIVNRPFQRGGLFDHVSGHALPDWAADIDCSTWAQFFLKFVISHPAVTCAIPATSQVEHMRENMGAALGPLPDQKMRDRMSRFVRDL